MPAQKEIESAKSQMSKPEIRTSDAKTMITYSLNSLYDLGHSVAQVTHLMKKLAPKHEYIRVKQETLIKAEKGRKSGDGIRLHFIIPK